MHEKDKYIFVPSDLEL